MPKQRSNPTIGYLVLQKYAFEILVGNAKINKAWEAGKRGIQKE